MNIVFMGTPDFAIPSLQILIENNYKVAAIVTAPDKERGRGQKVSFTPVKEFALKHNLPVLQPEKLKNNPQLVDDLKKFQPDLFVVVAFRILPKEIFNIPTKGSFNLHASLLPKYRGAAPIQWALINGETETGVTTFKLEEQVDTGNVYLQEKVKIKPEDNFESLHDKLGEIGAMAVLRTVKMIETKNYELKKQDDTLATPAPKIIREICHINWNKPAEEIHNLVRGLSPYPAAFFIHNGKVLKVYKTEIVERNDLKPFQIEQTKKELIIGCGKYSLRILELQQEGRRRMYAEEFLRGFKF